MAATEQTIEEISVTTIEAMHDDMIGTKYKLLNEVFVTAVASGGKISLKDEEFQKQKTRSREKTLVTGNKPETPRPVPAPMMAFGAKSSAC